MYFRLSAACSTIVEAIYVFKTCAITNIARKFWHFKFKIIKFFTNDELVRTSNASTVFYFFEKVHIYLFD